MAEAQFEPRIVAFLCRWCAGAGADLAGTSRLELAWRLLNDRLLLAGQPGRAPYHAGFSFQLGGPMDLLLSLNLGMGFDGWLGLAYRYY